MDIQKITHLEDMKMKNEETIHRLTVSNIVERSKKISYRVGSTARKVQKVLRRKCNT